MLRGPKDDSGESVMMLAETAKTPTTKQKRLSLAVCRWKLKLIFQTIIRSDN